MNDEFAGLSLIELLDLLEPVPEPPPPSLWPQTIGWLWVAVALLALVMWLAYRWRHRYAANAYRRAALAELEATPDDPALLSAIVRRTALAAYPRAELAHLHGKSWLGFRDKSYVGTAFSDGLGRVVASAPYRPASSTPELRQLVADWIRRHRAHSARR